MGRIRCFLSAGLVVAALATVGQAAGGDGSPAVADTISTTVPPVQAEFTPVLAPGQCVVLNGTPSPGCQAVVFTPAGPINITISAGRLVDVGVILRADLPDPPPGIRIPFGALTFRVVDLAPGRSVTIRFDVRPRVVGYLKLVGRAWRTLPGVQRVPGGVEITLTDGGQGDDDGVVNGQILDPGALTDTDDVAPAPAPATTVAPETTGRIPTTGGDLGVTLVLASAVLGLGIAVRRMRASLR